MMLALLLTIPSIFVNTVSAYHPYTPSPGATYLLYSTSNGSSYITVYITLPHTGFSINWGTVVRDGDNFWVNSEVWDLGWGLQVITTFSHTYDLGVLLRGDYTFTFKAWNTTLKSLNFTSLADRIEPATFQLFESPTNKPLFKVAWNPDGSYALLVARASQGYGSEIFRFDGNSYTLLLNDSSIIIQGGPAWKPDGSYALFTAHYYANQNHRYKVLKYDGVNFSTIQEGGTDDMWDIAWKPDGSYALIVGGAWRRIIWKYDGINFTRIYGDSVFSKFLLVNWEPEGNYVMIADFFYGIFKFNGTTLTKLASYGGLGINAIEWSADGNYALITIYSNEHPAVLKFDGTKFTDVTSQTGTKNNLRGISSSITGGTLIVGGGGTVLKYDGINFTTLTKGEYGGLVDVDWKPSSNCALSVGGKTVLLITLINDILPVVNATIDVDPNNLNLKSKGRWITCYIKLTEDYNVNGINRTTILLNGTIPVDPLWVDKPLESVVGDYDNDTIPDLMVKFDRAAVISYIISEIGYPDSPTTVTLTVAGELIDGTPFEGSDTIRTITPVDFAKLYPGQEPPYYGYGPISGPPWTIPVDIDT